MVCTDWKYIHDLISGEGFHNYHHTFPHDYAASEFGSQLNLTKAFIDLMCFLLLGLAKDCRRVTRETIIARAQRTGDGSHKSGWFVQYIWEKQQTKKVRQHTKHLQHFLVCNEDWSIYTLIWNKKLECVGLICVFKILSFSWHVLDCGCYFRRWYMPEVFNPAPGDPLSWKVYFQPASAHLPAIFKQSWGAWLTASGVFD